MADPSLQPAGVHAGGLPVCFSTQRSRCRGKERAAVYLAGDALLGFVLGDIEIILALEADPEFGGGADIPGKAESQFRADTAPPTDEQIHGGRGDPQAVGNR